MDGKKYKKLREEIGSQEFVAKLLGVNKQTLSNRERGKYSIGKEQSWAILHLVQVKKGITEPVGTGEE